MIAALPRRLALGQPPLQGARAHPAGQGAQHAHALPRRRPPLVVPALVCALAVCEFVLHGGSRALGCVQKVTE